MSLLEAFFYTFDANGEKLEKALDDIEKKTKKTKDEVALTDQHVKELGSSFADQAKNALKMFAAIATVGALKSLSVGTAESTSALGRQAEQMRVNVSTLDAWKKSITESGGDAEAFAGTMQNLARRFKDPEAALLRYSKALGKMDAYKAHRVGKMAGLDEGTIELLRKGKIGVEDLLKKQREQGVVTDEQVKQSDKFNQNLRSLGMSFDSMKLQLGTALIPVMQWMLDKFGMLSKWVSDNKQTVTSFFAIVAGIITAIYLPAMFKAIAATYTLLAPFILIGLAIAAVGALFALAYDDVMNFLDGNNSIIGTLSKKWPWIGELVKDFVNILKTLWDYAGRVGDKLIMMVTDPMQFIESLKAEIKGLLDLIFGEGAGDSIFDWMSSTADFLSDLFNGLYDIIKKAVGFALDGFAKIGDAWKTVKGWFGAGEEEVKSAQNVASTVVPDLSAIEAQVNAGRTQIHSAANAPVTTMTSSSITNSSKQASKTVDVKIASIEINTQATDANGIANGLNDQLKGVIAQRDNGLQA